MKVGFGYEMTRFWRDKYWNCGTIKTHEILENITFFPFWAMCHTYPISALLSKCPAGKKLGEISTKIKHKKQIFGRKLLQKSHKNQTQKTKFLEENTAKIVLFEKKTFFNFCSIFVKKKKQYLQWLIYKCTYLGHWPHASK